MTHLCLFAEDAPDQARLDTTDFDIIQAELARAGIRLERWQADQPIDEYSTPEDILAAYQTEIDRLVAEGGYQSWDVIAMHPQHPDKAAFREKFLAEHTHSEDEVRFFVRGSGLFTLHLNRQVYAVLCEQNDLIRVPAGTRHWFDMGPNPEFTAIRLFNNPEGWVANFTGEPIAEHFPRLEN
jgi:1,2-dihydroxy-3-keto-5-methylthiopentene dioxygenase